MAKTPPAREDIIVVHVDFAARIHLRSVIPEICSGLIDISRKVWHNSLTQENTKNTEEPNSTNINLFIIFLENLSGYNS